MDLHRTRPLRGLAMALLGVVISVGAATAAGLRQDGTLSVTPAAKSEIDKYQQDLSGRFGALAVSQDGAKTVSYICRSRLWKNCDEAGNEDSNIAIPSGKIARDEALTKCRAETGSACIILFINDDQQREFSVQQ